MNLIAADKFAWRNYLYVVKHKNKKKHHAALHALLSK